jgi:hypothetical protein
MFKRIIIIIVSATLMTVAIGVTRDIKLKNEQTIKTLKFEIESLLEFKKEKSEIENMEKTLLICYDISKYEAHYYSIIYYDFATKYNTPWQIYPAVIRIESNFNPTVLSSKSAKGIAQVLEATGKNVAIKLGINYVPTETLWNDLLCQIIGFTYLSDAIKEKGLEDGVKCYIGGIGFDKGRKDIGEYRTTVQKEFDKLKYVYLGVIQEGLQK